MGISAVILCLFFITHTFGDIYNILYNITIFGAETLVLTAMMLQELEGVHVGFLPQVEGMTAQNLGVDTCQKEGAERVLKATGTKPLWEYIERRQAAVAEWVSLRPIFKVCAKDTGFEGGGGGRNSSGSVRQPRKGI